MYLLTHTPKSHSPWNKGKIVGQKSPLKLQEVWAIRIRLQIANAIRDLALFNLAYRILQESGRTALKPLRQLLQQGEKSFCAAALLRLNPIGTPDRSRKEISQQATRCSNAAGRT